MSRPTIPPTSNCGYDATSQQTVDVLESRLSATEMETKQLINQLKGMGFGQNTGQYCNQRPAERDTDEIKEPISPYKARIADKDVLQDNYETLVSRVCKTESAIQTLKLNLININGKKDLKSKTKEYSEEKITTMKQSFDKEIGNLKREIEDIREDLKQESEDKVKAQEEVKELKSALEEASTTRAEAAVTADELANHKQKMQKKMVELKEELEREKSIRSSLEDSHNTLLGRVREMEAIVESERSEVKILTTDCTGLRQEAIKVREELRQEQSRREMAESGYSQSMEELERLKQKFSSAESDRKLLMTELTRLRTQYDDLIKQLEQTQVIVDQQKEMLLIDKVTLASHLDQIKTNNTELTENNEHLNTIVKTYENEKKRLKEMHKKELEAERSRLAEKQGVEDEALQYKLKLKDVSSQNDSYKKKISTLEKELNNVTKKMSSKEEEYSKSADGLQSELHSLKHQLQVTHREKEKAFKDKEALLEEVNQTVDGMSEERSKLQGDVQQARLDLETQIRTKRQLEQENATLLDRIASFEQQKDTQQRIENTMKDMMEQKNKLAYENGRLQSQVSQLQGQLELMNSTQGEATQYRKMNETLQNRYDKAQREISDQKITIQKLESQVRLSHSSSEPRDRDFSYMLSNRDDSIKEKTMLMEQLRDVEERSKNKVNGLQKNLEDAKTVNKEISATLEAVMSSHSQLQSVVESLQTELGKKDTHISQLKADKNKGQQEWKLEIRTFEERMENLREELRKEREKSYKKTSRDIGEIKKQNDNLQSRNMELVKANTELRHKITELESSVKQYKEKFTDQKRKNDYLHRSKKDLEDNVDKVKDMKIEMEEMERLRDEYMKRNHEQGEMINTFMDQISSLQSELGYLSQKQSQTQELIQQRDQALEKERLYKEEVRKKYKVQGNVETRKQKEENEFLRRQAEDRLRQVQDESVEISGHLEDAHEWFKTKFDRLQDEIVTSRKLQAKLERENMEQKRQLESEQLKSHAAAAKAKEMIRDMELLSKGDYSSLRASRETVGKLADYSEIADHEAKQQIARLQRELLKERDHAKYLELKHEKFKEASARQLGSLLKEYAQ